MKEVHPGLYRYRSEAALNKTLDSCLASIKGDTTLADFFRLVSFAVASIKDGHTYCGLPDEAANEFKTSIPVFPAKVVLINKRAFIFCCKQNAGLQGAELLSINQRPVSEIVETLFSYTRGDGDNQSRKNWRLAETFSMMYALVYGRAERFEIGYLANGGKIQSVVLRAEVDTSNSCANPFPAPGKALTLQYPFKGVGLLSIKTFSEQLLASKGDNFPRFIDSAFVDINHRKVNKLLIDLRGNGGGEGRYGGLLYAYLSSKAFRYYDSISYILGNDGKLTETDEPYLAMQQPQKNHYTGKVYFLMDGRSFSTTAEFLSIAHTNKRGQFLGEEAGGAYYGNTSGVDSVFILPATKVLCRIPMLKFTMKVTPPEHPDRGIMPDRIIYPNIKDILEQKDGQLLKALKIVSGG